MTSGGGVGGSADTLYIDILARADKLETSMSEAERVAQRGGEKAGEAFEQGYRRNAAGRLINAQGRFVKEGEQVGQAAGEAAGHKFSLGFSEKARANSQMFAGILAGLTGGAAAAGVGLVKLAGDAEQAQVAFTTLLGSADKAKSFLVDLNQFAANTPFELTGLQESSKRLLAFGFQAQQIIPMMTAIGDAVGSLGGGADVLDGVVTALGQIQAKGKLSAEEMAQIAERGIPAWQFLADQMGITVPEAMKKAEQGAISASEAIPAILQGMQNKFGGGMEAQSKTLLGMWSTTTDTIKQSATQVGQQIVEALDLKGKLTGFNEFLNSIPAMLKGIDLKQWASDNGTAIAAVGGAITAMLLPALAAGAASAVAFITPLLPFAAAGAAIVLVLRSMGVGLDDIKRGFESAKSQAAPLMDTLSGIAGTVQSALTPVFRTVGEAVRSAVGTIQSVIQSVLLPVFSAIAPHVQPIMQSLGRLVQEVAGTVRDAFNAARTVIEQVLIPAFQLIWPVVKPVLDIVMGGVKVTVDFIAGLFRTLGDLFRGDWAKAWGDMKATVSKALDGVGATIQSGWERLKTAGADLGKKLLEGFQSSIDGIQSIILSAISNALRAAADKMPGLLKGLFQQAATYVAGLAQDNAQGGGNAPVTGTPPNSRYPGSQVGRPYFVNLADDALSKTIVGQTWEKTGNKMADEIAGWCARWVRLTLDNAAPQARNTIEKWFAGDANDIKNRAANAGILRKDLNQLKPGDTVVYDKNHVGIYLGEGLVRGNNQWGAQNGRSVVSTERLTSLGSVAGYIRLSDLIGPQPVTQQPKTSNSISDVFKPEKVPAPDPQTLKDYRLTLKDWNALQGKALDLARQLKKAEDDRNYSAQITLQGEIKGWEGTNKARAQAFSLAQKIVSEQAKGTGDPITTAQIAKAQQLTAALEKATKAHDPRAIDAAKTAMDNWSKASEGNARALAAVQSAQSGLKKSADDYVATQKDLATYGDKALVLIKAQESAQKSGDAARILAANNALEAFQKQGKAQAAVLEIERAAYQSHQQLQNARARALQNVAEAVAQGNVKAAQRGLDEAKRIQSEEVNAVGLTADQRVKVYESSTGKILKAAYALHAEEKRQADAAVDVWAKSEEAKALTSKERDAEVLRRKGENRETERQANLASQREQASLLKAATDLQISEGERAADALRKQAQTVADLRYKLSADLVRYSYGQGDAGLVSALASITGFTTEQVSADVDKALAEAERLNAGLANAVKNAYATELDDRKETLRVHGLINQSMAEESERNIGLIKQQEELNETAPDWEGMARELLTYNRPMDDLIALAREVAKEQTAAGESARVWLSGLEGINREIRKLPGAITEVSEARRTDRSTGTPTVAPLDPQQRTPVTPSTVTGARGATDASWRQEIEGAEYTAQAVAKARAAFESMTIAQLESAKATAKSRAEYDLIVSVLTGKTDAATAAGLLLAQAQDKVAEAAGKTKAPNADLIAALEKLRGAAGVNQEELEKLISGLQKLDNQAAQQQGMAKATDALNTWGNYAKQLAGPVTQMFAMMAGASGETADAWAQDMGNMVNDLVSLGTAIARGDWAAAAVQVLTTIANWFVRNKKAAEEAAKAVRDYNNQFKFTDNGYGTMTQTKTTTGFLFWSTDHYTEQIDTLKRDIALALEDGFATGITDGFMQAIEMNNFSLFEKNLQKSVGQAVLKGLIESFMQEELLKNKIGPAIQQFLKDGNAAALREAIRGATAEAETFYNDVLKPVADEFGLTGSGQQPAPPEGSIAELRQQIADLQAKLANATTDPERDSLRQQIKTLQTKLDAMEGRGDTGLQPISSTTSTSTGTPTVRLDANVAQILDMNGYIKNLTAFDATLVAITPRWEAFTARFDAAVGRFEALSTNPTNWAALNRQG